MVKSIISEPAEAPQAPASTKAAPVRDFSDKRVFVIGASDSRAACLYQDDHFGYEQSCDGPTFIVVGQRVADERLQRNLPSLNARFGVTLEQLLQARGSRSPA